MTWVDIIVDAMNKLGGKAHLRDIYDHAQRTHKHLPISYQAIIRREIESHSTDSHNYRENCEDLFYSVSGIGSGHWGYRKYKLNNSKT